MTVLAAGRVPGPVDVRLVPALVLTMATCLAVTTLPYHLALLLPWVLLAAAVTVCALLLRSQDPRTAAPPALSALTAMLACALWIAAIAAVQAVGDRAPVKASGWEDAVGATQPVRMSGEATGTAARTEGAFGESWHVAVVVESFGHPARSVPGGTEVVVSGAGDWQDVDPRESVCFTADLEAAGSTVFARARTGPHTGFCPATDGSPSKDRGTGGTGGTGATDGTGATTGREAVRAAVRDAAAGSAGAAPQLLPGLVLGDRSLQDPELDEAMKAAGLSHLSAVSGDNFVKEYTKVPVKNTRRASAMGRCCRCRPDCLRPSRGEG